MANDVETKKYPPDFTPANVAELENYKENGIPGVPTSPEKIDQIKKMYLDGLSFNMISNQTRVKRAAILYLAEKYGWFAERQSQMVGLLESINSRTDLFTAQHVHFIIELCNAIRTYYLDKINQFAATKDPAVMENMNSALMNVYNKCVESLKNKSAGGKDDPNPLVGIMLGQGATLQLSQQKNESGDDLSRTLKILADINRKKDES